MMCRPIFWAIMTVSMNSASLKPLQMIGVSSSARAMTASSSGLLPTSRPKPSGEPYWRISSTTRRCWFTLTGNTPTYSPL